MLKPPVWTWEIPAYFFVGGIAGVAGAVAGVAAIGGVDPSLVRDARWVALAGAVISPALLISDLGRPERFLNMLRVFKRQSAMSVGVWTLTVFSTAVFAAIVLSWIAGDGFGVTFLIARALDVTCIVTGLLLATYTGVLLGATTVPVWARHATLLPAHFGASSLGAGAAVLELVSQATPALHVMALAAAIVETMIGARLEGRRLLTTQALGAAGPLTRLGDVCSGPLALVLRLISGVWAPARTLAGVAAIAGSLSSRYGWLAAGRQSVRP